MRARVALPLALSAAVCASALAKPAAPPPEVRTKYGPALSRGRKLESKRDWKGAIAAFQECLAVVADDPVALSEIGWSAFNIPDLELAEKSTQAAVKAGGSADLRGATLYNLGLIKEARGDKAAAIAAYEESLKARPNETVRGQLAKLDAAAAQELDPFKPVGMSGPYPSLEAYCKQEHPASKSPADDDGPGGSCGCWPRAIEHGKLAKPRAPYVEARVFAHGCTSGEGSYENAPRTLHLGVRVAAGWFVGDLVETRDDHYCNDEVQPKLALADAAAGAPPALLLRLAVDESCGRSLMNETSSETFYVAGVGPSGEPSLTPPVQTVDHFAEMARDADGQASWESTDYVVKRDLHRRASFAAGKLTIEGTRRVPAAAHDLAFP